MLTVSTSNQKRINHRLHSLSAHVINEQASKVNWKQYFIVQS